MVPIIFIVMLICKSFMIVVKLVIARLTFFLTKS